MNVFKGNQTQQEKVYEYHWVDGRYYRVETQLPWCMYEIGEYEIKGTPSTPTQKNKGDFKILKKAHNTIAKG